MATILIVDDRAVNRQFLVTLLGYSGHRLVEASDGAEGLERARSERPDLIITDILMPTMNGYEFVQRLRQDPSLAGTPVIFYTATYLEREANNLARSCGVSLVISKPSEPEAILSIVNEALGLPAIPPVLPDPEKFEPAPVDELVKVSQRTKEIENLSLRLAALIELGLEMAAEREPQRLLEKFCHASRKIAGATYAVVAILDENGKTVRRLSTSGAEPPKAPSIEPLLSKLLETRRATRGSVAGSDVSLIVLPPDAAMHSFVGAPILSQPYCYGGVYLLDKLGAQEFSEEDERLVDTLAAQVRVAYENARLYEEIQRYAGQLQQEVGERRRAEEAARQSEANYRSLVEGAPYGIYRATEDGKLLAVNPALVEMLGYGSAEELLGVNLATGVYLDPAERLQVIERRKSVNQFRGEEAKWKRKDGKIITVRRSGREVYNEHGNFLYAEVMAEEVTELKLLEAQLRQAQKMEAVGRLAGGIAHDFNNLLNVILGYSGILLERPDRDDKRNRRLEQIKKSAERAVLLTRQLLAFSRKQVLQLKVLDLNAVVVGMHELLRRLIGEDIELLAAPDPALGRVKADRGQIEQVIMNLAVNARDAMPQGGKLTIETANVELDEVYIRSHPAVPPGRYVMLAVSDTGVGMNDEVKAHIFEPFFTTKEKGKGTGLGLATVYGIVKQSGGYVWAYSEPQQGTTFKIYLPRVEETATVKPAEARVEAPRGSETVLLVEDEASLRELSRYFLESGGYKVLEAGNGLQAVQLGQQHKGPIHLLLSDVVMPEMGGRQLAESLAPLYPKMKVLYVSGYTDDAIANHGVLEPGVAFLEKPFSREGLLRKVREVLGPSRCIG